jgi:type I restriction enzyme, R subunit
VTSGRGRYFRKQVLTSSSLEEAEREDDLEMGIEDQFVTDMKSRGPQHNVSTFAFTATPKEKTLELFGHRGVHGRYPPFSLYSMRPGGEAHPRRFAFRARTTGQTTLAKPAGRNLSPT